MKSKRQPAMPKVGATWEVRQLDAGSKRLTLLKWLGKTPTSLWIILAFVFYKPEVTCVSWWQILKSITVFDQEQILSLGPAIVTVYTGWRVKPQA